MAEVRDLDVLRPPERPYKLGGQEIDCSFVPTGITFDIDNVVSEMAKLDQKKIGKDDAETLKAFNLGVKLCVVFCEHEHPEMTEEWFRKNTSARQVRDLGEGIREALAQAYEGIDPKN